MVARPFPVPENHGKHETELLGVVTIVDMRAEIGQPSVHHDRFDQVLDLADTRYAQPVADDHDDDARVPRARFGLAFVAVMVALCWVGGMVWASRALLPTLDAVALTEFLAALSVVPALIGILWLLVQRTSRAEARRFGATAQGMRAEARSLEDSVGVLAGALDTHRRALAEQIAQLLATGDAAHDRFATIGRSLGEEIARADDHTQRLVDAAGTAQASLGVLLASVPRAHGEIVEASATLDRTALSAGEHAAALDAQLLALAERGREAEALAGGAAQRLAAHIARMEATSETAGARLEAVTGDMSEAVDGLMERTADAVDQARRGIAAQGDAMLAMLGAHQASLDQAARESADALASRIATTEGVIERIARRLEDQRIAGDGIVVELEGGIARVERQIDTLHHQGIDRSQMLAASIGALGSSADAMTEALRAGDAMATRTIGTTESLLIALDAAAREIDETLPDALTRLDRRIGASRAIVVAAKPELLALVTAAESTHDAIEAIAGVIGEQRRTLDHLSATLLTTLTTGRSKADAIGHMVDETIERTERFSEDAAPKLIEALLRVRDTASAAADRARETLADVIPEAAAALEQAASLAMRRAAGDTVERQVRAIGDATDAAVENATRATARLAAEVRTIDEQSAIVESRIDLARTEREEAGRDSFARRAALLIEALNSASIDITKSLAPEISENAWAAYLKGDRGVFTRRAVRILDAGEARDIGRFYDEDGAFREAVNRYIHDFESMLRGVLAERDGSPLGVTLLSSDMGKLYVSLAQAIERLR